MAIPGYCGNLPTAVLCGRQHSGGEVDSTSPLAPDHEDFQCSEVQKAFTVVRVWKLAFSENHELNHCSKGLLHYPPKHDDCNSDLLHWLSLLFRRRIAEHLIRLQHPRQRQHVRLLLRSN